MRVPRVQYPQTCCDRVDVQLRRLDGYPGNGGLKHMFLNIGNTVAQSSSMVGQGKENGMEVEKIRVRLKRYV